MISKIAFFFAVLAAVHATALLHGIALGSTGLSSSVREQDGFGNFAFRYDIDAAGASSSHAETGSTIGKVVAAPTLLSAPIAAHGVPALVAGPAAVSTYGVPVGLGAGIHGVRAYGPGILGLNAGIHGVRAYGPGIHGIATYGAGLHGIPTYGVGVHGIPTYGAGIVGLNTGKLIL